MNGLMATMAATTATPGTAIPLDLVSPLEPYRTQSGLSIRVERLPFGARLSKGRNNGDNSWSLTLEDLDGLHYLPPEDLHEPHNLTVRVIKVDTDSASTLMRFEIPIGSGDLSHGAVTGGTAMLPGAVGLGQTPVQEASVNGFDPIPAEPSGGQSSLNHPPAATPVFQATETAPHLNGHGAAPAAYVAETPSSINGHANAPPLTGGDTGHADEWERRLSEARAAWEAEHQGRVAVAVQEAVRKAESDARTQLDQSTEVRLALELERRMAEARAAWEGELQGRIAAAVQESVQQAKANAGAQVDQLNEARLAQEVDRRLAEARASWEAEFQGRLAVALEDAAQKNQFGAGGPPSEANDAQISQEVERRLSEARTSWEVEHQEHLAAAVQEAVQRADSDARAQMTQTNQAHLEQAVEQRLADARVAWEAELQGRIAVAVEDATQRAEASARAQLGQTNEAQLAQEVERRLGEARASWESELQGRVAAAVQDAVQRTQSDASIQLEQARQEWQNGAGRELAEMTARCTQAEAALAEARTQRPGQGDEHALRALRDELSSTQALNRAREAELAELRQAIDRTGPDTSGRAAEAEANLERNRAAWQAEREQLVARAEEDTQARIKHALEKWQNETQAALAQAKQEWMEAEDTRLAVAEAQWRENIGIAKSRTPITPMAKRSRRVQVTRRFRKFIVIAACLAAAAMFYPKIEPMVVDQWWPKFISYKGKIEPSIDMATTDIKAWVSDVMKRLETSRKGANSPPR